MDVFSLLNFWRNAGVSHPIITTQQLHFDLTSDDDNSFFDLVFTNTDDVIFSNNKRKVLPLDSSNTKSPFRALFHNNNNNNKSRSDKKKIKREVEVEHVTISSLLKTSEPSKRFSKDVVHKYLNLIKPLYVKVSGKSNEKVTSSGLCTRKDGKPTVFKRLGKSRSSSASSAGKVTPAPAARRSSDSDLQHDGIQSAILHCKKSYGSGSASYLESWICIEELKRCSI